MKIRSGGFGRLGAEPSVAALLAVAAIAIAPGISVAAEGTAVQGTTAGKSVGGVTAPAAASADSSMTFRAGQGGTQFRSMTGEGGDRVHVAFGGPDLNLDL